LLENVIGIVYFTAAYHHRFNLLTEQYLLANYRGCDSPENEKK